MDLVGYARSLVGGAIIGLAVSVLLVGTGRVAGISGVVGGVVCPTPREVSWRLAFIAGLLVVGAAAAVLAPAAVTYDLPRSSSTMAVAGVLVGFGTRLGNGCTSGHGVAGLARLSVRSAVATATFMAAGVMAATAQRLLGGAP